MSLVGWVRSVVEGVVLLLSWKGMIDRRARQHSSIRNKTFYRRFRSHFATKRTVCTIIPMETRVHSSGIAKLTSQPCEPAFVLATMPHVGDGDHDSKTSEKECRVGQLPYAAFLHIFPLIFAVRTTEIQRDAARYKHELVANHGRPARNNPLGPHAVWQPIAVSNRLVRADNVGISSCTCFRPGA